MDPAIVNLPLLVVDLVVLALLWRRPTVGRLAGGVGLQALACVLVAAVGRASWGWLIFGPMSVVAWWGFVHVPVLLLLFAARARAWVGAALAAAIVLVGVDAFLVEPRWLEVTHLTIRSPELDARVRIALVADLQTDHVGEHEAAALAAVRAAAPDLVLFAGDYLQVPSADAFAREAPKLNALLHDLDAPAFAVEGDVDTHVWPEIFAGTGVVVTTESRTLRVAGITVTLLSPDDSRSARPPVPDADGFHVVVGHAPDYALAAPPADLLLAGHTHGGQVRLPGIGPLVTLSAVPRAMAAGHTDLGDGRHLVVSRGIGMERREAPRLRFLCRPEVVIVDVVPAKERLTTATEGG